jgi:hypothetical protein
MPKLLPLILTYDSLNLKVRLTKFRDDDQQRKMVSFEPTGLAKYSINGSPIDSGIQYEEHRIWTFEAVGITMLEKQQIELMVKAQNSARRLWNPANISAIRLHDWITPYVDIGTTRTRGLASDGLETAVVRQIGEVGLSYAAAWNIRFDFVPEFENTRTNGTSYNTKIVLKELDRVLP